MKKQKMGKSRNTFAGKSSSKGSPFGNLKDEGEDSDNDGIGSQSLRVSSSQKKGRKSSTKFTSSNNTKGSDIKNEEGEF